MRQGSRLVVFMVVVGLMVWAGAGSRSAQAQDANGDQGVPFVGLEIDGVPAGFLESLQLGTPGIDLLADNQDTNGDVANVQIGEVSFQVGAGMSKRFYSWVQDSVAQMGGPQSAGLAIAVGRVREFDSVTPVATWMNEQRGARLWQSPTR